MTKVLRLPNADEWEMRREESFDTYHARQVRLLEELEKAAAQPGLVGKLLYVPVGDGKAIYQVCCEKPLRLYHIPYGDAYHASPIWLRGLRLVDVIRMVRRSHGPVWKPSWKPSRPI